MLISQKQLKKIRVETQSGQFLGYVAEFEMETDTGIVEKYFVKSRNSIRGLWENSLVISRLQIVSFDQEKIVVEDNAIKAKSGVRGAINKLEQAESALTSEKS